MPKLISLILSITLLTIVFLSVSSVSAYADDENKNFNFWAQTGTQTGTVTLSWDDKDYVESYNIAYGLSSGNHVYGVTNVGNIESYTIGGLTPGQTYYFVLSPVDDGNAMAYTAEVHAVASGKTSVAKTVEQSPVARATGGADTMVSLTTHTEVISGNNEDKNFHLRAMTGSAPGTVTLRWDNKGYTETYNIAYGPQAGNYIWGVTNVGHVGEFTIGGLTPGQTYYFVLSPVDDNVAFPYSPYVSAVAAL